MKSTRIGRKLVLSAVALCAAFSASANAATLELGLAIDGSGSISNANFILQRQAYVNVLSDLTVLPRNGTVAIGVKLFASGVSTVFTMAEITNANHAAFIAAIAGMSQPNGGTNIAGALDAFTSEIFSNSITSTRQLIDVSTDGFNNIGNLNTSRTASLAAGIDQINCIGVGGGADCSGVIGGVGSFSVNATNFNDFEAALRRKIIIEVNGAVPEPATWAMMIAGFGLVGSAMRRRRERSICVTYA